MLLLLHLLQIEMHAFLFLSCFVLAVIEYLFGAAYMVPEERLSSNRGAVSGALSQSFEAVPPPVIIVGKVTASSGTLTTPHRHLQKWNKT